MTLDQLIEVGRALRSMTIHPTKNTRAEWEKMPKYVQDEWIRRAIRLQDHLFHSGLAICASRFPMEGYNEKQ